MKTRLALCLAVALGVGGCGPSQAKLDEAQGHVREGLEAWKKGGKPADLQSQAPPVEFHEELWNSGAVLLDYELGKVTYSDRDKVIRCEARLTVRPRKGAKKTENVVYDVYPGSPVKVVNNPMP